MTATRLHKWIVAIWGLAAALSASDLYLALEVAHGDLAHPNSEIQTASTHFLLAVALVILYSHQPRRVSIIVAATAVVLAILITLASSH
jgi:hypothetical protein